MQKTLRKYTVSEEKELDDIDISLFPGDRIFFQGDLGAGKTTLIRHILRKYLQNPLLIVRSPTYTYYQKYDSPSDLSSIYHFDLYRVEEYETFVSIGGEEIVEDDSNIALIEWPEILGESVHPTKKISITMMEDGTREIIYEQL